MLEDSNEIDMAVRAERGIVLVITDAGMTPDGKRRMELLQAKLKTYAGYILSDEFSKSHPGTSPHDVTITVMCRNEPSGQMKGLSEIRARRPGPPEDLSVSIPVTYQVFNP